MIYGEQTPGIELQNYRKKKIQASEFIANRSLCHAVLKIGSKRLVEIQEGVESNYRQVAMSSTIICN